METAELDRAAAHAKSAFAWPSARTQRNVVFPFGYPPYCRQPLGDSSFHPTHASKTQIVAAQDLGGDPDPVQTIVIVPAPLAGYSPRSGENHCASPSADDPRHDPPLVEPVAALDLPSWAQACAIAAIPPFGADRSASFSARLSEGPRTDWSAGNPSRNGPSGLYRVFARSTTSPGRAESYSVPRHRLLAGVHRDEHEKY